ncbi:OmpA family protein [Zooshikella ganghwensis]|uniref:OmpA-like domain-containing protein n=1 Tax=Zooshikella ganghwensis TaxID=202772 RepID=A0A4P9VG26_9GAMM|nr:OmpA family protein [Zooshikella ganghwensis]RDH41324.1 hypothetical protein B9G39_29075 [Zooshikella ganghwensis]
MKKTVFLVSGLVLVGCNTQHLNLQDASIFKLQQRNVIERDLTRPAPTFTTTPIEEPAPVEHIEVPSPKAIPIKQQARYFIDFANDSVAVTNYKQTMASLLPALKGKQVFIIGHSHGHSHVGTSTLAVKRAKAVKYLLEGHGIPAQTLHTLAFWSETGRDFAPAKGVQVVALDSQKSTLDEVLLSFNAEHNSRPQG